MFKLITIIALLLVSLTTFAKTKMVTINDVQIAYQDSGQGDAVVVFDAGFGTPHNVWSQIQSQMNTSVRTISYSRAGIGRSSAAKQPRSITQHVADLRALLAQLEIKQPIIYVTHSYSGLMASELAHNHPQQIRGLLMLDPATDAQQHQFNAADKARVARDDAMLIKYMPKTMVADYQFLLEQLNAAPKQVTPLPSTVPTTIITASKPSEQAFVFSETVEGRKIWVSLHQQLISNNNVQKTVFI